MENKTLHLTLKKKWFDMILSGKKKEEYREIKMYWINRLVGKLWKDEKEFLKWLQNPPEHVTLQHVVNKFDTITFKNGYSKNAPQMEIECLGIAVNTGNSNWGAEEDKQYFVISLGEVLNANG